MPFETVPTRSISAVNKLATSKLFAELPHSFAIQLTGADAAKVVNNLSTNEIVKLAIGASCETFVTDARGWVVAHAVVVRRPDEVWLLGSHHTPDQLAKHLDRYIIREAAVVNDLSDEVALLTIHDNAYRNASSRTGSATADSTGTNSPSAETIPDSIPSLVDALELAKVSPSTFTCLLPIWGSGTQLLCCPREQVSELSDKLRAAGYEPCDGDQFQWLRVTHFWPLQSVDIGDKTIPQELDRDQLAISFTKGCYLGQETIARLDARGQLQKKLCLIELDAAGHYAVGDAFQNGEKEVGKITSLAHDPASAQVRALAYLRRGNFDAGRQLTCNGFAAHVLR